MNIPALVGLCVFYVLFIVIGLFAIRKKRWKYTAGSENEDMLAGRNIGCFLGTFSMTATWVGGAYMNGTAEMVYKKGIAHAQMPWGYALSLIIGGIIFAKKMRREGHVTMLDPLQERYGSVMGAVLLIPALAGELFWSAAILSSLGSIVSRMLDIEIEYAIIASVLVVVLYTLVGGLYAVAYTDVFQLFCIFVGLWLVIPFAVMNKHVSRLSSHNQDIWLGNMQEVNIAIWVDKALLLALGGIPWQVYFQRVLSAKSGTYARVISFSAAFGCVIVAVPVVMIGIVAKSTDWESVFTGNNTGLLENGKLRDTRLVLTYVVEHLTPSWVSYVALAAISAAVMSSVDSSILSSTSMLTHNVYKIILRKKASPREVAWVTRFGVLVVGVGSATLAVFIKAVPDYWVLSCDIIYVLLFPQLLCAVFLKFVNVYGSVLAALLSLALRLGAGEKAVGLPVFIKYPYYDNVKDIQLFPFRTFTMGAAVIALVLFSLLSDCVRPTKKHVSQDEIDILRISYKDPTQEKASSFSKITRFSGSYNNITACASELRSRDDRALLRTAVSKRDDNHMYEVSV